MTTIRDGFVQAALTGLLANPQELEGFRRDASSKGTNNYLPFLMKEAERIADEAMKRRME